MERRRPSFSDLTGRLGFEYNGMVRPRHGFESPASGRERAGARRRARSARTRRRARAALAVAVALAAFVRTTPTAHATPENDLDPENLVSDSLPSRPAVDEDVGRRLPFAILPQAGYGPATGPKAGVKFEGRDLFGDALVGDVNLLVALKRQQKATVNLGHTALGPFMLFGTWAWYTDPAVEFFGLGNNALGPDPVANYEMRRARVGFTVGYRALRKLALVLAGFYRDTNVKNGADDDTPSIQRFAPGLYGVHGAPSNYLSAALVYNSRDDLVRPTEGWEVILKYLNADHALFNRDTDYQKVIFDVSFIQPLVWRRQVIALHANTEAVFGDDDEIPFFELSSLGGDDTMRGYFPQRFLGKGSMLLNAEYRLKLVDFNFRRLWDVSVDGVAFGDLGRVFADDYDFTHHPFDHVRHSYGGGLRIGLSSGLVARIDAGFSPEHTGLVYLTFGHTF
ncbi:MAG: BamA/TamA family outer membrane protein [Deltaproteobacteria bacterium]|nr:BamA/TamA family outer membrane protein [Deltaproteobacteria bacterium]